MTAQGRAKCQSPRACLDKQCCHWIVNSFKQIIKTFLDDWEENEFAKDTHAGSTHEEMDGSSSCTQSTPFLSPSTVSGRGHRVDLGIRKLLLLQPQQVKSHFGLCGSEATRNRLPLFTKGQIFDPVCFCYSVLGPHSSWVQFFTVFTANSTSVLTTVVSGAVLASDIMNQRIVWPIFCHNICLSCPCW